MPTFYSYYSYTIVVIVIASYTNIYNQITWSPCYSYYPYAPCMEYLPTFAPTKSPSYVGKYTSTMEHMGYSFTQFPNPNAPSQFHNTFTPNMAELCRFIFSAPWSIWEVSWKNGIKMAFSTINHSFSIHFPLWKTGNQGTSPNFGAGLGVWGQLRIQSPGAAPCPGSGGLVTNTWDENIACIFDIYIYMYMYICVYTYIYIYI